MLFYFPCAVETHIAVSDNVLVNGHLDTRFTRYTTPCPTPFCASSSDPCCYQRLEINSRVEVRKDTGRVELYRLCIINISLLDGLFCVMSKQSKIIDPGIHNAKNPPLLYQGFCERRASYDQRTGGRI